MDLISDVGGMLEVCLVSLAIVAGIANYDFMSNYLAAKLYKIRNNHKVSSQGGKVKIHNAHDENRSSFLSVNTFCNI